MTTVYGHDITDGITASDAEGSLPQENEKGISEKNAITTSVE